MGSTRIGAMRHRDPRSQTSEVAENGAKMGDDRTEWTPPELIAELRARERARGRSSPASSGRSYEGGAERAAPKRTATGVVARFRRLDQIPSSELAKRAADLQRGIYGVDDRKDAFEVKDKRARPLMEASLALV